jgi:His/Glu/Gln/Arg/opine family amino acid ABC transporter permease subunit
MLDVAVFAFGLPILLGGLINTCLFCAVATALGLVLGSFIAFARIAKSFPLRKLTQAFIAIMRNTPFLVQAFLIFFALPQIGLRLDASVAGIIILSLYATANFAEAIRGAILAVPKGQAEAARAVGMPYLMMMRRIVFPQMLGFLIPALTNQVIGVIKESAALSVITVPEITEAAQVVVGQSFSPIETYFMVALLYWALTAIVAAGMARLERRFGQLGMRAAAAPRQGQPAAALAKARL